MIKIKKITINVSFSTIKIKRSCHKKNKKLWFSISLFVKCQNMFLKKENKSALTSKPLFYLGKWIWKSDSSVIL